MYVQVISLYTFVIQCDAVKDYVTLSLLIELCANGSLKIAHKY
jgi:hypothetical protein